LTAVPQGIPNSTTVLDLSGNRLTVVDVAALLGVLSEVVFLNVSHNRITSLEGALPTRALLDLRGNAVAVVNATLVGEWLCTNGLHLVARDSSTLTALSSA
jgi:Leucine-rich repeat (LRR) protein